MQNAAFAARGLDWAYVACEVAPERLEEAIRGLAALGFAGANVTIPHKEAAARLCDEADGDAVNTLVFRDGRVLGSNTDREILRGIEATRACLIGAGGAAKALLPALPARDACVFSRRGDWPPDAGDADLVVNATPVTTSCSSSRGPGRPSSTSPTVPTAARPRSSRRPARPAAGSSSTGSRRSSARAPPRSSAGPGSRRPSR